MIRIGEIIDGRYEILKEIGRGGMSIVYLAMDNRLNKSIVVKEIRRRDNSNNKLLMDSLKQESDLLKNLDHAALPKIYDIIDRGDIYVVMDYIEGRGWINPRIEPYHPFMIDPSCNVLHYAQEVFEGLKAYRTPTNDI